VKKYYLIGIWALAAGLALFLVFVDEKSRAELQSQLQEWFILG
tara:strand:- start:1140 stop:1268 length:129 start_codon:yes stop_codon:yes gene_type:complete